VARIAVIGLGAMGSRMAQRLLDNGHEIVAWNRDRSKAHALICAGAAAAETPAEAAREAEAVITMVSDPAALREVTEGEFGVLAGIREGATLLQMSTVGPDSVLRLASLLRGRVDLLDAPVLGSIGEVEAGTLHIFVGGPSPLVARLSPVLEVLGRVEHVGAVGAGSAAKLIANATLVGVVTLLGESLALGRSLDLPQEVTLRVLAATPLAPQAERRRPALESGEYAPRFTLSLARKDVALFLDVARRSGTDLRILPAAGTWFADAEAAGLGEKDYSAVLSQILEAGAVPP
jgi:3-hydroxyisobutyrate dehydrogenase